MTAVAPHSVVSRPFPPVHRPRGSRFLGYASTTDPKVLGVMYIVTSFVFFMVGGLLALLMRAELARPGLQFLAPEQYNQLFTMHGTIMLAAGRRPDGPLATDRRREQTLAHLSGLHRENSPCRSHTSHLGGQTGEQRFAPRGRNIRSPTTAEEGRYAQIIPDRPRPPAACGREGRLQRAQRVHCLWWTREHHAANHDRPCRRAETQRAP